MNFFQDLETAMTQLSETGAFLTAKTGDVVNTMTISWGFIGFMWKKPYFITMVRPQRYTKEILDKSSNFTISIPYDKMKEELKICGSKSGRDIDKSEIVKFVSAKKVSTPIVSNCDMYYECEVRYIDKFDEANLPKDIISSLYKDDYHHLFFGEIVEAYKA